ncbi:MAG: FtsH protease activity modulator HflK [Oscillospiraceae bacterium]|nr:FtsH protease activity modulator HflK [Oscillospiraceae bacterium]
MSEFNGEYHFSGSGGQPWNGGQPQRAPKKVGLPKDVKTALRIAVIVLAVILIGNVIFGSFYNVSEQQNAVVTMFGKVVRTDSAGLHFKVPLLQQVRMVDITTHGTGIGYTVSPSGQNIADLSNGVMITSDFNLINIDFYLEYRVSDPVAYLYNSRNPEEILKNIALASIRSTVVNYTVDEAMTTGKSAIQAEVKSKMVEELTAQEIGLQIVNITIQDAEPPTTEIINAFKNVETVKQSAETTINQAKKYASEQIPAAEAQADRIIQNAEAQKAARIAEAEGQVARFNAMFEQYSLNPLITKQLIFYETLEDILPNVKLIITDGSTETLLPVESFAQTTEKGA